MQPKGTKWPPGQIRRLVEKLKTLLDLQTLRLFEPPPDRDDPVSPSTGILAGQFPEWFITQDTSRGQGQTRSRILIHRRALTVMRVPLLALPVRPVILIFVQCSNSGRI